MRSLPFPRRLQLVKLLRAHGLRDVERLREDELKQALARLHILLPDLLSTGAFGPEPSLPTSTMPGARAAPPPPSDDDDPHCLPRFREPRVFLPEGERTFLRVIAVKPRQLFFTWDIRWADWGTAPGTSSTPSAQLHIMARDYLGDPPSAAAVAAQAPAYVVDIDVSAPGWYVNLPGDRTALVAVLVKDGAVVATSNLALTTPSRPAPPGPYWEATVAPGTSRKALRKSGLLKPGLPPGATLVVKGQAERQEDAELHESGADASGAWIRERRRDAADVSAPSSSSLGLPTSTSLPAPESVPLPPLPSTSTTTLDVHAVLEGGAA